MLKKVIVLSCILLVGITVSSKERTWSDKQNIALNTLKTNKTLTRAGNIQLSELYTTNTISIVGNNDMGYVVVSNDDKWQPILGYSSCSFDKNDIPEGMMWWINAITEVMELSTCGYAASDILTSTRSFAPEVAPLVKTSWSQGNPYNYLCPSMAKGGKYVTGCGATAISQIMNYHRYPDHGQGSYSYVFRPDDATAQQLTANFEDTYYDWDNMLDTYSKGYNDAQRDAVATLMFHCGVSIQMAYTTSGSGSYGVETTNALRNYFRYNENVRLYNREYYSAKLWMQMLYEELNNKRPVYYSGISSDGGHAFVIDGYNAEGLVHVNWGWGGKNDGYYDIAILNPPGFSFANDQTMIANICTPDVETTHESQLCAINLVITFYNSTSKRLSLAGLLFDGGAEDFEGKIAAILQSSDTTIVAKEQEGVSVNALSQGFAKGENFSLRFIDITNIPDGKYRAFLGCKSEKDNNWQVVRVPEGHNNSIIIEKSGSEWSSTDIYDDLWTGIPPVKQDININKRIYDLHGRKMGTNPSTLRKGIYIIGGKKVVK